jgi:hypothetical protein
MPSHVTVDDLLKLFSKDFDGNEITFDGFQKGEPITYDIDDTGNASFMLDNETYQLRPAEFEEFVRKGKKLGMKFEEIPACFTYDDWVEFRELLPANPTYDEILVTFDKVYKSDLAEPSVIKDANTVFNFLDKKKRKSAEKVVDSLVGE